MSKPLLEYAREQQRAAQQRLDAAILEREESEARLANIQLRLEKAQTEQQALLSRIAEVCNQMEVNGLLTKNEKDAVLSGRATIREFEGETR